MDPKLEAAQRKLSHQVMGKPGVTGTAIGEKGGRPCLKVYVAERRAKNGLPGTVDGFPVEVEITGPIRPL